MTDGKDRIGPGDAREALDAIQRTEHAGLRRAIPPRWFGATVALIVGGIFVSAATGSSTYTVLLVLALAMVLVFQRDKAGASPKALPSSAIGILALIGLMIFFLLLVAGARVLSDIYGMAWAPLAGGAAVAAIVYILSVSERRSYLAKIGGAKDQ